MYSALMAAYSRRPVLAPRLSGVALRAFVSALESVTVGPTLLGKVLRDSGFEEFRKTPAPHSSTIQVPLPLEADAPDPLPLNGWKTFEFRVAYDLGDKHFQKSILLVKLNAIEELRITVTGPVLEYPKAAGAAMACLRSWHKQ